MRMFLAAVLLLGLGACGKDKGSAAGGSTGSLEAQVKVWRDKMCACGDKICTERTMVDYAAWKRTQLDAARAMAKSERAPLGVLERELKACRKQVHSEAGPHDDLPDPRAKNPETPATPDAAAPSSAPGSASPSPQTDK